jgi:hypothetical protein
MKYSINSSIEQKISGKRMKELQAKGEARHFKSSQGRDYMIIEQDRAQHIYKSNSGWLPYTSYKYLCTLPRREVG